MGARLYPYLLEPKLTSAIWGGDMLIARYGKHGRTPPPLGESWECWDANAIRNGGLAGRTLADCRALEGTDLVAQPERIFPVLTKIIDAHAALSVQVHPDDAYAQRVEHQPNGKTECWYVLDCTPGAEIVLGWVRDTSREEYERRVADGTLGDLLRRVPVAPGDVFYLPAGTLHAIGAGIQIFETQQASDLTYRIFDWNRTGPDGKPRELHIAKAADVLDFRATFPGAIATLSFDDGGSERTLLIGDARFVVERITVRAGALRLATDGRALTLTAMDAHLRADAGGESALLAPWQTIVVPAALDALTLIPGGEERVRALVVHPAPDLNTLRARALAGGASAADVTAFFMQF